MNKRTCITCLSALVAGSIASQAAVITWGAATAVSTTAGNSSDVSTSGTVHHAMNGLSTVDAAQNPTVNGVSFTDFAGGGSSAGDAWVGGNLGDAAYDTLLSNANFGLGGPTVALTLGGGGVGGPALVDGQDYQIQIWFVDDRADPLDSRVMTFNDGEGNSIGLNDQYVIGTFTASGTTQTLGATTGGAFGQAHISAMQIRAVPEPSSVALLGLGGLALILRRRV